jgi:hypothetical protein
MLHHRLFFAFAAVIISAWAAPAWSCSPWVNVSNGADSGPGSLREAVLEVCPDGVIDFDSSLAGTEINISLSGTLLLEFNLTIQNSTGNSIFISGGNSTSLFSIGNNANIIFRHLTLANGHNTLGGGAGAVYIDSGASLGLENVQLFGHRTTVADSASAIFNRGDLSVQDSIFSANGGDFLALGIAPVIYNAQGTVTVNRSSFVNNSEFNSEAGVYYHEGGSAEFNNNTWYGNSSYDGAGLRIDNGTVWLRNNTIAANMASMTSGITQVGGDLHVLNSIVMTDGLDCSGTLATNINNFIGDGSCAPLLSGNPLLGFLQNNGGATPTLALLPGSTAIDAGDDFSCLATDQRGIPRPQGLACDIGAYEANPVCLSQTEIPTEECESLLELWHKTDGPNWTNAAGNDWNVTTSPCTWTGVTCGDGVVSELNLNSNNLVGTVPDLNLPALYFLDLSYNQLNGNIPNFNNLYALGDLRLNNNALSGTIPDFSNTPFLYTLYLDNNLLTGTIPDFSNLPSLFSLSLSANYLSGTIPSFSDLPNLYILKLSANQLSGELPDFSTFLTLLEELFVNGNTLSGIIPDLPPALIVADFSYNSFIAETAGMASSLQPDWPATQTIAPENLSVSAVSADSVSLTWTPISYSGDSGYYEVLYSTVSGGPYTSVGATTDKSNSSFTVTGLIENTDYYFTVRTVTLPHAANPNEIFSLNSAEVWAMPVFTCTPGPLLVDNTNDSSPGSLRQAVTDICPDGVIDFSASVGNAIIYLSSGYLLIDKSVTIQNSTGMPITLSGSNMSRIFAVEIDGNLTLRNLNLRDGFAALPYPDDTSPDGGAVYVRGYFQGENLSFSANEADSANNGHGGAVFMDDFSTVVLSNTTFSGNRAGQGGALYANIDTFLSVNFSTFAENNASLGHDLNNWGTVEIGNSVLASAANACLINGTLTERSNNWFVDGSCNGSANGAPLLSPLNDHGGAVLTHALLPGSFLLDAAGECIAADARSISRPQGVTCDIGAFESQGFTLAISSGDGQVTPVNAFFTTDLEVSVTPNDLNEPMDGGTVSFFDPYGGTDISPATTLVEPQIINISGGFARLPPPQANNIVGTYTMQAYTTGGTPDMLFFNLENSAAIAQVFVNVSSISVIENAGDVLIVSAETDIPVSTAQSVELQISGTAELGLDYQLSDLFITIPAGSTSGSVSLTILDDTLVEGTEEIVLTLINPSSGLLISTPDTQTITIIDDDVALSSVSLSVSSNSINEADSTPILISAVLSAPATTTESVELALSGSASLGADYQLSEIFITIPAGSTSGSVSLTIIDDTLVEGAEEIILTLINPSSGLLISTPDTQTITIIDDDVALSSVSLSVSTNSINEADSTPILISAVLSAPATTTESVELALSGSASLGADYQLSDLFITIPAGSTNGSVSLTIIDDTLVEGAETIILTLINPSSGLSMGTPNTQTITIIDDDVALSSVSLSVSTNSINEADGTPILISAVLSAPATTTESVELALSGSASLGADYQLSEIFITIPAGSTSASVSLTIIDDTLVEGTETIVLTLINPSSGLSIGTPDTQTITIIDDDSAGLLPSATTLAVTEGTGFAVYSLALSAQPQAEVQVWLSPDAQVYVGFGSDSYVGVGEELLVLFTPLDWNVARTLTVLAVDDDIAEGDHQGFVSYRVESADPAYQGLMTEALQVDISDNDVPAVLIIAEDGVSAVTEGGLGDTLQIYLTSQPNAEVLVTLSPDAQLDLGLGASQPLLLLFTPDNWQTPVIVHVNAVDDDIVEGAHQGVINFTVSSADTIYHALTLAPHLVAITDNDSPALLIDAPHTVVSEGGESVVYQARLATRPSAEVRVIAAGGTQLTLNPAQLLFTPDNWAQAQAISVSAIDDTVVEGLHHGVVSHRSESSDVFYDGLSAADILFSIYDNDHAGLVIEDSPTALAPGASTTYHITLPVPPRAEVLVQLQPAPELDLGNGAGQPYTLIFTPDNWGQAQAVFVQVLAEAVGGRNALIHYTLVSADPVYHALDIAPQVIEILGQERPLGRIVQIIPSLQLSEDGPPVLYSLSPESAPLSPVIITLSNPDGQTQLSAQEIIFTPANWEYPQTVFIYARNDGITEGPHHGMVFHHVESTDSAYAGIILDDLYFTIADPSPIPEPPPVIPVPPSETNVVIIHHLVQVHFAERIDFGNIGSGEVHSEGLGLLNLGDDVHLSNLQLPPRFFLRNDFPAFLASGDSVILLIGVDSNEPGYYEGNLSFTLNSNGSTQTFFSVLSVTVLPMQDPIETAVLHLSNNNVSEQRAPGALVGQLSAPELEIAPRYVLLDDGNGAFMLDGDSLRTAQVLSYPRQALYRVTVGVADTDLAQTFTIYVKPLPPLGLDNNRLSENRPAGTWIGRLAGDPETLFRFAEGYPDQRYFSLDGNVLRSATVFDYELRNLYTFAIVRENPDGVIENLDISIFIEPESRRFSQVALGWRHACGIELDDSVSCWGWNNFGQSRPPEDLRARAIATGANHSCALDKQGVIICWGGNESAQLRAPLGANFRAISAGGSHNCAINQDGRVLCWGYNHDGQSTPPPGRFKAINAGGFHTCAISEDDTVQCWGWNNFGQTNSPAGQFRVLASGEYHSCALDFNGAIQCWGKNQQGQSSVPENVQALSLSAGEDHSCAVTEDHGILCWGGNRHGQLDVPGDKDFRAISTGGSNTCALRQDLTLLCQGLNDQGEGNPPAVLPNYRPLALDLHPQELAGMQGVDTVLGHFSVIDLDPGDIHVYTLLDGAGDNHRFRIDGTQLRSAESLPPGAYNLLVQVDDGNHGIISAAFILAWEP